MLLRKLERLWPLAALALLLPACYKKDIQFGEALGNSYTKLLQVDTVAVSLSTYVLDSFATNTIEDFAMGTYSDTALGLISARPFLRLSQPTDAAIENGAIYDSLTFTVRLAHEYYGDTMQTQQLVINELDAPINYTYGTYLFNTSTIAEKPVPLGTKSVRIRPHLDDSVSVRLDDAKGRELFNKLISGSTDVTTADGFLNYFKGVSIGLTSATPGAIHRFHHTADSVFMSLHYHTGTPYLEKKTRLFAFSNDIYFNRLVSDRSGTPLVGPTRTELPSVGTGNHAFVQGGMGVLLKLGFPTLRNLLQADPTIKLMKATLVLRVPPGSYDGKRFLPAGFFLSQTDASNNIGSAVVNTDGSILYGTPMVDNIYDTPTYYSYDLTSQVNTLLTSGGSENNGFFLLNDYPGSSTDVSRALFNNSLTAEGSQLVLSFLSLKN